MVAKKKEAEVAPASHPIETGDITVAKKKAHCIEVVCSSMSEVNGELVVNQELILREYASTPEELVIKNLAIVESGFPAILEACKGLARGQGVLK
jgi:hypothetical protein